MPPRQLFASPSRPLSDAQQRVLLAIVDLCPDLGAEVEMGVVAEAAGVKPSATTLALGGLRRRKFVEAEGSQPQMWHPTFAGRELVRRLPRPDREDRVTTEEPAER